MSDTAQNRIDWCDELTKEALQNLRSIAKEASGAGTINDAVRAWVAVFDKAAAERKTANLTEALNAYMAGFAPDLDSLEEVEIPTSADLDFNKVISTLKGF